MTRLTLNDISTCMNCGDSFVINRNSGKGIFCKQSCAASFIGRQTISKNRMICERKASTNTVCPVCGKAFESWASNNRKYCSTKCSSDSETRKMRSLKTYRNTGYKPAVFSRGKSGWVELGGKKIYARSGWEANYARFLQLQKDSAQISEWQHEPDTFWFDGIKRGVRSYLPDFKVTTLSGDIEYHEVKGWMDSKSKTKIKRMKKYHPTVKLVVIDASSYRKLASKVKHVVTGWE